MQIFVGCNRHSVPFSMLFTKALGAMDEAPPNGRARESGLAAFHEIITVMA
jgi:hypothetical protein